MAKLWQFLRGHSKPAFSKRVQKGAPREIFFKNRLKRKPRLKGRKTLLRKWYYPLLIMHLKGKDWRSAQMAKLSHLSQGHPKAAFSEKVQRGDQEKFFKNRPKGSPRLKNP